MIIIFCVTHMSCRSTSYILTITLQGWGKTEETCVGWHWFGLHICCPSNPVKSCRFMCLSLHFDHPALKFIQRYNTSTPAHLSVGRLSQVGNWVCSCISEWILAWNIPSVDILCGGKLHQEVISMLEGGGGNVGSVQKITKISRNSIESSLSALRVVFILCCECLPRLFSTSDLHWRESEESELLLHIWWHVSS